MRAGNPLTAELPRRQEVRGGWRRSVGRSRGRRTVPVVAQKHTETCLTQGWRRGRGSLQRAAVGSRCTASRFFERLVLPCGRTQSCYDVRGAGSDGLQRSTDGHVHGHRTRRPRHAAVELWTDWAREMMIAGVAGEHDVRLEPALGASSCKVTNANGGRDSASSKPASVAYSADEWLLEAPRR